MTDRTIVCDELNDQPRDPQLLSDFQETLDVLLKDPDFKKAWEEIKEEA